MATHSLRTVAAIATDLEDPRTGVAVYAFARDRDPVAAGDGDDNGGGSGSGGSGTQQGEIDGELLLHFTEVFADVEAAASHLTDLEGDVLTEMFANTNYYGGMTSGVVYVTTLSLYIYIYIYIYGSERRVR